VNQTWERAARAACAIVALTACGASAQERSAVEEIEPTGRHWVTATRRSCGKPAARAVERKGGAQECLAREVRPGSGPGVVRGRLRAAAEVFRRFRQGRGPRVAPGHLPVDAAGHRARGSEEEPVRRPRPQDRQRRARGLRHVRVARRQDERADQPPERGASLRDRPQDLLPPRRALRFRVRDLPWRGQHPHPPAGPSHLTKQVDAQRAYTSWPATASPRARCAFQWRLEDCFRQQRFPHLEFTSEASIALTMFLAKNANGAPFNAPSIKR